MDPPLEIEVPLRPEGLKLMPNVTFSCPFCCHARVSNWNGKYKLGLARLGGQAGGGQGWNVQMVNGWQDRTRGGRVGRGPEAKAAFQS